MSDNEKNQDQKNENSNLGKGAGFDAPGSEELQPVIGRVGDELRPYCSKHNVLMRATGSNDESTNYACPAKDCDATSVRLRPTATPPRELTLCPQRKSKKKQCKTPMVVKPTGQNSIIHLKMQCPECGYECRVPRPDINRRAMSTKQKGRRILDR